VIEQAVAGSIRGFPNFWPESRMEPQKFFYPVLEALDEGRLWRTVWAVGLRCVGVLIGALGIYAFVELLRQSFQAQATEYTIAGLLLGLALLATAAMILQVFFYRAACIRNLPKSPFTVIPIFSIMLRTAGEVYAILASAVGISGCLFLWISRQNPLYYLLGFRGWLPSVSAEGTFLGGLVFGLTLLLVALVVLILSYFLAESIVVLADIATNMRVLNDRFAPGIVPSGPAPNRPPLPSTGPVQESRYQTAQAPPVPTRGGEWGNNRGYGPEAAALDSQYSRRAPEPAVDTFSGRPAASFAPMSAQPVTRSAPPPPSPAPVYPEARLSAPPAPRVPRSKVRIVQVQRCRQCNAEIAPGTVHCYHCGLAV